MAPGFDTLGEFATALGVDVRDFFEIGDEAAREGRDDPLVNLIVRLAFFDPAELQWANELLTFALAKKPKG